MAETLADLANRFRNLTRAIQRAAEPLAEEALSLVQDGFEDSKDPYGEPWAELKTRNGKPLIDTANLQNSWHVKRVSQDSFTIAAGTTYAHYHQDGTKNADQTQRIPPRKMVPDAASGGMPKAWEDRFAQVIEDIAREELTK